METVIDENGNIIRTRRLSPTEIDLKITELVNEFDTLGLTVKKSVDKKRELEARIAGKCSKIVQLEVENEENAMAYLSNDPLDLIESDFPFFPDETECANGDTTIMEIPEKCVEAMRNFVKLVHENLHRFKHLPLGPLYSNIKVNNKKWAPLIEYVLRPYLFSFLVDNIVDGLVMEELVEQFFPGAAPGTVNIQGVMVPKHFVFSFKNTTDIPMRITSIGKVEFENLLDSVTFDNESWPRFLSKTIGMEKIFLLNNENLAFLLMSHISITDDVCIAAYTMDGFRVNPFPNFGTTRIRFHHQSMYLENMPNRAIGEIRSSITKLEKKVRALEDFIEAKRKFQALYAKRIENMREMHNIAVATIELNKHKAERRKKYGRGPDSSSDEDNLE